MDRRVAKYATCTIASIVLLCGCVSDDGSGSSPETRPVLVSTSPIDPSVSVFKNGMSPSERARFYHLPEGSEVFPLSWLQALNHGPTGRPFLENAERFGLISDPYDASALPIGLSVGEPRDVWGKWIGVNCAACHVGSITRDDERWIIDGAPNMFDIEGFYTGIASEVQNTVSSPREFWDWLRRLLGTPAAVETAAPPATGFYTLSRESDAPGADLSQGELATFLPKSLDELTAGSEAERAFAQRFQEEIESDRLSPPEELLPEFGARMFDAQGQQVYGMSDELYTSLRTDLRGRLEAAGPELEGIDALSDALTNLKLLKERAKLLLSLVDQGVSQTRGGAGRTDAFGRARNIIFGSIHGASEKRPLTAPICYPSLWGFPDVTWLHWNANTTAIVERNIGQAIGLGAVFDPSNSSSTVLLPNLLELEQLARKLEPPGWPFDIDPTLAAEGEQLYAGKGECASCHDSGGAVAKLFSIDQSEDEGGIETDRNHAANFDQPVQNRAFPDALQDVLAGLKGWLETNQNAAVAPSIEKWRSTRAYPARPLHGIWASAPYLHNGSVPTLNDLLLEEDSRPKTFHVGSREFDIENVGYRIDAGTFEVDTSLAGNSNKGHRFGTDFTNSERRALIEYLKTL